VAFVPFCVRCGSWCPSWPNTGHEVHKGPQRTQRLFNTRQIDIIL